MSASNGTALNAMSSSTQEATKKWQAESLVKRILEVTTSSSSTGSKNIIPTDAAPQICALSYDLQCEAEFEEALSTLLSSKERQIQRTCANGFADFALQVDSALEFSSKIDKTKQLLGSTSMQVNSSLSSRRKSQELVNQTQEALDTCIDQQRQLRMCIKWLKTKEQIEKLVIKKDYRQAIQNLNELLADIRLYPASSFATRLSNQLTSKQDILKKCELELQSWMIYALDQGRELGFAKLDRDDTAIHSVVNLGGSVISLDKEPVSRFFAIHRKDYAEEYYSTQRTPALKQTLSALTRASTISPLTERVVRFRNCLAEICGFFLIEKHVGALSKGELAEIWLDCSNRLLESLRIGYPVASAGVGDDLSQQQKEAQECAEILACDTARCCIQVELEPPPQLIEFFKTKLLALKQGWTHRSYSVIKAYAQSKQNKVSPVDSAEDVLPFCTKTRQEITRAVNDALVLEKFLGSFRLFVSSTSEQVCEKEVVSRVLRETLDDIPANEQAPSAMFSSLENSLFVYRAAREMAVSSSFSSMDKNRESYNEVEQLAREKIQGEFVNSKVHKYITFEQAEFVPVLTTNSKLEPHRCLMDCLYEIERAFSASSSAELASIPREVRASLLAETMSRLAEIMESWVFKQAQYINPIALKIFSLDINQIEQFFPDHSERFSPLQQTLTPFCVEGQGGTSNNNALEIAIQDASKVDRERLCAILTRFKELDSSSRLFGPANLKKRIHDLREHDAKRYLQLLQAKADNSMNDSDLL